MASKSNKDPSVVDSYLQGMGDSPLSAIKPKQDFDPTDYINVKDFYPDTPGALPTTAYYPTAEVNPVVSQNLPGRYFSVLPVVSGGDVMFPAAAHDARIKALQDAAYHKAMVAKKDKENFFNTYKRELGPAQYQGILDKKYGDELMNDYKELWATHSPSEAHAISSDVNHPWTKAFLKKYWEYDTQVRLLNNVEKNIDEIEKEKQQNGQQFSSATNQQLAEFHQGTFATGKGGIDQNKLAQLAGSIPSYKRMDQLGLDDVIGKLVDEQVTIDDAALKDVGYEKFAAEQTKKVASPENKAKFRSYVRTLDPQAQYYTDDMIDQYFDLNTAAQVKSKTLNWSTYHPTPAADGKAEQQAMSALERYKLIMTGTGGDPSVFRPAYNTPYKDGTITNVVIVPKGTLTQVGGKMVPSTSAVMHIEYKDDKKRLKTDNIEGEKNIVQATNKLLNYNREGTTQFVNPEDINALYEADPRNQQNGNSSQNDPLGIR